jgi:hypothetical protein
MLCSVSLAVLSLYRPGALTSHYSNLNSLSHYIFISDRIYRSLSCHVIVRSKRNTIGIITLICKSFFGAGASSNGEGSDRRTSAVSSAKAGLTPSKRPNDPLFLSGLGQCVVSPQVTPKKKKNERGTFKQEVERPSKARR